MWLRSMKKWCWQVWHEVKRSLPQPTEETGDVYYLLKYSRESFVTPQCIVKKSSQLWLQHCAVLPSQGSPDAAMEIAQSFPGAWGLNLIGPFVYIKVKLIATIFVNHICHHCCPPANATKDNWVWLEGFLFVFEVNQAGQKSNTSSNLHFCGSFEMRRVAKPFLRVYFFLSVCYLLTGKGVKTSNSCSIEKFLPHLKLFIEVLGIKNKIFVSAQIP